MQLTSSGNEYDEGEFTQTDMILREFHVACHNIIANKEKKALNYAVNYAKHGLYITDPHEMKVQSLYILNNMTHWRGDLAKEVRATLKVVSK